MTTVETKHIPPTVPTRHQKVAILDCGAQYTKVIDRRIREQNIYSDIVPLSIPAKDLTGYHAIILSGGPNSVFDANAPHFDPQILHLGIPVLGICYGMQLIAHHMGGVVAPGSVREFGETAITQTQSNLLFSGLPETQVVLMSHGDKVTDLPPGFETIAVSGDINAAMQLLSKKIYGVQFHPEVELTEHGEAILRNFLYTIAGLAGDFPLANRLDDTIQEIRDTVGSKNVFVLVSGGVDSAVTAALLLKTLPPQNIYALHIDTGFMRHQESDTVCEALKASGLQHLQHLKAEELFLNATSEIDGKTVGPLKACTDPEEKRRIIGDTFFHLTQKAILDMNLDLDQTFIAQGTLRPDLIESGNVGVSQIAHKIKTHHNDVPIIQEQREKGLIIEPNRDWHKDEIRKIGKILGLPAELVERQPFPGPGLAIRTLCTDSAYITPQFQELHQAVNQLSQPYQLQANILPVKSVGVQGDYRTYSYLCALSGEYTKDWDKLRELAHAIPNTHREINRVALVLAPKEHLPPIINTITPTHLTPETLSLLRQIDFDVNECFRKAGLLFKISQLLTVLVPVDSEQKGRHSIAIRAVVTSDFMTARPAKLGSEIPWEVIEPLAHRIQTVYPIDRVMVDLTSKPPATVEWE